MTSDKTKKKYVDPKLLRNIADGLHHEAEMWRAYSKDDTLFVMNDTQFTESILTAFDLQKMVHKEVRVHKVLDMLADRFYAIVDAADCQTCTIVDSYQLITTGLDELELDDMCHFNLSCGHDAYGYEEPKRCPECGAVVIGED